jgi:hypothetical protein
MPSPVNRASPLVKPPFRASAMYLRTSGSSLPDLAALRAEARRHIIYTKIGVPCGIYWDPVALLCAVYQACRLAL